MGIPHGGVLSVTLFLVAINRILEEFGNGIDGSHLADDLAIYITRRNQIVATRALQGLTNKLDAWAPSKTVCMIFRKRRKRN